MAMHHIAHYTGLFHNQGGYCNCLLLQALDYVPRLAERDSVCNTYKAKGEFLHVLFSLHSNFMSLTEKAWDLRGPIIIVIAVVSSLWPSRDERIEIEGTYERY